MDERPAVHAREDTLAGVLDAVEHAVEHGRAMPMSTSVLVNRTELLHLLGQARAALPEQLGAADDVLAAADELRARARAEADGIIRDARSRAEALVAADAVVTQARARADAIEAEAAATAERLRREADDYCDRRLAEFEIDLGRVLAQVQAGRAKLAGRLGEE